MEILATWDTMLDLMVTTISVVSKEKIRGDEQGVHVLKNTTVLYV